MKEKIGVIGEINIKLTISFIVVVIGILLICAYCLFNDKDLIKFITAVIGGVGGIYTAFYVEYSLKENIKIHKINNSLQIISEYHKPEFVQYANIIFDKINNNFRSEEEFYNYINKELNKAVGIILNYLSRVAVSIKSGYADEHTLYMSLDTFLPQVYEKLFPYIKIYRQKRKSDLVYKNLEELVNRWKNKEYLSTKKRIKEFYW